MNAQELIDKLSLLTKADKQRELVLLSPKQGFIESVNLVCEDEDNKAAPINVTFVI